MDKPWFKSVTVLAAIAYSVLGVLEQQGVVPSGGTQSLSELFEKIITSAAVFGFRRAIG